MAVFILALSAEERLIQETARRFAEDRLRPGLRTHEQARGVSRELAREFRTLGLDVAGGAHGLGTFAKSVVLDRGRWPDGCPTTANNGVWKASASRSAVPERGPRRSLGMRSA
jgi:hypothetical protein